MFAKPLLSQVLQANAMERTNLLAQAGFHHAVIRND
jgi:hypothetical protein